MRWARIIVVAAVVLGMLFAALLFWAAWYGAGQMMHPPWMRESATITSNPRLRYAYQYDDVEFATEGGAILRGWYVPSPHPTDAAVVTVHGAGGNREEFIGELKWLHEAGYPVLMFDCRGHGQSDWQGRGISLGVREHRDVESAVRYVKQGRGAKRVAVFGCSQGAASSILAGAEDRDIDAVIAEASFAEPDEVLEVNLSRARPDLSAWFVNLTSELAVWRMGGRGAPGPADVIAKIAPRPVMIMQGGADVMVPPRDGQLLYARARQPKTFWLGDGAQHCGMAQQYPDQYPQRVLAFLIQYMRP